MSARRFILTLVGTAVVVWLVGSAYVLHRIPPGWDRELAMFFLLGTCAGLAAVGILYLVFHAVEIQTLCFPAEQLRESEQVLRHSPGSLVHYASGGPFRPWSEAGGRLFLTNQRVVFVTFRMQLQYYRLSFELGDILKVEAGEGLRPGEPLLTTGQGQDRFTFGAFRYLEAEEWAAAVLLARYRAHPDREWSEQG